jgi:hypothetical protein
LPRAGGEYERFVVGLMLGLLVGPIDFAMQRRQSLNIRTRVGAATRQRGAGNGCHRFDPL